MFDLMIKSGYRGNLSWEEAQELSRKLCGVSRGRFVELLFSDENISGRIYLRPIKFETEDDVEKILIAITSGAFRIPVGPMIKEDLGASVGEILMNACMHAEAKEGIVFVGEYVVERNILNLSVYDKGIGFRTRIVDYLGDNTMTSKDAILWALKEGHSIDKQNRTSGIGLNETVDFMRRNGGLLEIISGNACWRMFEGEVESIELPEAIEGALVNFSIVIDNSKSYLKQVAADFPQKGLEIEKQENK